MEDVSARERATSSRPRILARKRDAWFLALAAVIVLLDQVSKSIIRATVERGDAWPGDWPLKIVHLTNSGAAFGFLQNSGPLLIIVSIIGMAAILIYLVNPGFAHPLMRAGLAFMLGGAVGNLIDRLRNGEVVDFIKVPNWPAFNVADSAITIGVLLLIWALLTDSTGKDEGSTAEKS